LIEAANTRVLARVSGGSQQTLQLSTNQWNTIVYSKEGNTAKVYIDGVVVSERTGNTQTTQMYKVWDCQYTSFAQFGTANRTWGQEDVDAFHNGGSFMKYADL
jgi:acetolactate synthase regulatory subunit